MLAIMNKTAKLHNVISLMTVRLQSHQSIWQVILRARKCFYNRLIYLRYFYYKSIYLHLVPKVSQLCLISYGAFNWYSKMLLIIYLKQVTYYIYSKVS